MLKNTQRTKALSLRKEGYSYNFIALKTGLSKSMLSYYLKDIPYTPNKKTIQTIGRARAQASKTKAAQKQKSILSANDIAKKDIGKCTERDIFMLGLGVYIGEGSKTQNIIRIVNTDYRIIVLFIRWLMLFGFTKKNFAIRIHTYPESDIKELESFWIQKTGLPHTQFQRACIDSRTGKDRKRNGVHTHGTAHVTVRSNGKKEFGVIFSRRIHAWMNEVLE